MDRAWDGQQKELHVTRDWTDGWQNDGAIKISRNSMVLRTMVPSGREW